MLGHLYHIDFIMATRYRKLASMPQRLMTKLNTNLQDFSTVEIVQMLNLLAIIDVKFKALNADRIFHAWTLRY